jgi:hypothetical protein
MSDVSQGPGWWIASDDKWYAPEQHPDYVPPPPLDTSDSTGLKDEGKVPVIRDARGYWHNGRYFVGRPPTNLPPPTRETTAPSENDDGSHYSPAGASEGPRPGWWARAVAKAEIANKAAEVRRKAETQALSSSGRRTWSSVPMPFASLLCPFCGASWANRTFWGSPGAWKVQCPDCGRTSTRPPVNRG